MEYRVCRNNPAPYNDLNGKVSLLGLGTMRLPLRDAADQTSIDEEKAQEIFDYAYTHGVNYFDTAYPYHGGMSEKFCGKALAKYPRASYHLASKLPGWLLKCDEDVPRIFNEQLANCRTDYFDFYLVHSVHESSWPNYVKYHAYDQLNELRKAGKIKRLGFSFHGSAEQLPEILAAGDWDFVPWIYGVQMSVRNRGDHFSEGKGRWYCGRIFQEFFRCDLQKYTGGLSGFSCGCNDMDPACMGKCCFCGSTAGFLVLSSCCDEIFRRYDRGYFRVLSVYL